MILEYAKGFNMLEATIVTILAVIFYLVMLWAIEKLKRRYSAKKRLEDNDYIIEFY